MLEAALGTSTSGWRPSTARAGCPGAIYSGRGQEGTHVGVAYALEPEDSLFPTHRDLTAQLTKGLDLNRVMAQFWGGSTGTSRGRDGNSHIGDWYGHRTLRGDVAPPDRLSGRVSAPRCAYQRAGERPRRDGDLRRRRDVERPVARGHQHVGGASDCRSCGS